MSVQSIAIGPQAATGPYRKLTIGTNRGDVSCRYYPVDQSMRAVVLLGGTSAEWDAPVHGALYPDVCVGLNRLGITALRVENRQRTDLLESVLDVLAGTIFLEITGVAALGLVGHGLGAAAVAQAATFAPMVKTLVLLAPQSFGAAEAAFALEGKTSILLMHGTRDEVLPVMCSEYIYALALERKELVLLYGAGHTLDEAEIEVRARTLAWLTQELRTAASP